MSLLGNFVAGNVTRVMSSQDAPLAGKEQLNGIINRLG